MNNLIIAKNGSLTMTSLDIAEITGKRHSDVTRDIRVIQDQLDKRRFAVMSNYMDAQNRKRNMWIMDRDEVLLLLTGYSAELRMRVIKRLSELENKNQPQIPRDFAEALQLAADQAKQLELAAPKVAFVDNFVESTGNKTFRQVAKTLKANERLFRAFLASEGFMYKIGKEWTAYQKHIDAGRFSCKVGEKNGHAFTECKFTPKGIEHIAGKWIVAGYI